MINELFNSWERRSRNAVPTVKITLGTPFPGVPAGNDPWVKWKAYRSYIGYIPAFLQFKNATVKE